MAHIHAETTIAATIQRVWERFVDHAGAAEWLSLASSKLTRPGAPDPNGVGAVRAYRRGRLLLVEEVTRFDAPRALDYRLLSGLPWVKHHLGQCRLAEQDGGVRLTWDVDLTFAPASPTWLVTPLVARDLRKSLEAGLARLKAMLEG